MDTEYTYIINTKGMYGVGAHGRPEYARMFTTLELANAYKNKIEKILEKERYKQNVQQLENICQQLTLSEN